MKKLLLALACICTLALASCGGKSPEDQAIDLFNNATKELYKADTAEEFYKVLKDVKEKGDALDEKYPDIDQNFFQTNEKARKALIEFTTAVAMAAQKTGADLNEVDIF